MVKGISKRKQILLISLAVLTFLIVIISVVLYRAFYSTNYPRGDSIVVTIPKGANFSDIADLLHERGVIESRFNFYIAGRILGWDENIQSGMFEIPPGKTNYELLNDLRFGRLRKVYDITIFEGFTTNRLQASFSAEWILIQRK